MSCSKINKNNFTIISIDKKATEPANLSEFIRSSKLIKLETNPECLISFAKQVLVAKNYIFIAEPSRVLQFDTTGRFIKQIGTAGHGPGEYYMVGSIAADTFSNHLVVQAQGGYFCYDFEGRFIQNIPVSGFTECISFIKGSLWTVKTKLAEPLNDGTFITQATLFRYNQLYKITDSLIVKQVILKKVTASIGGYTYYISDIPSGTFFYYPVLTSEPIVRDTLYEIESSHINPKIKFDFKDIVISDNYKKNMSLLNIYRTDRYAFVEYTVKGQPFIFCYDFKEKTKHTVSEGFNDDVYGTGIVTPRPLNLYNNELYFLKNGYEVEGLIDGVNENSNPVVVFLKIKQ